MASPLTELGPSPLTEQPSARLNSGVRSLFVKPAPAQHDASATCGAARGAEGDDCAGPLTQLAARAEQPVSCAFCPVCGAFLHDVGACEDERRAHVAACGGGAAEQAGGLDGTHQQGQGSQQHEDHGNWSEQEADGSEGGSLEEGERAAAPRSRGPQLAALADWLARHGLERHLELFAQAGATLELLPHLSEDNLREMGVATIGARKKLLLAASGLAAGSSEAAAPAAPSGGGQAARLAGVPRERGSGVGDWRALARGQPSMLVSSSSVEFAAAPREAPAGGGAPGSIMQYFTPTGDGPAAAGTAAAAAGSIVKYFAPVGGGVASKPNAATAAQQQPNKAGTKRRADSPAAFTGRGTGGGRHRRGGRGGAAGEPLPLRPWQAVPGTRLVVDRFDRLPPSLPGHRHWFLTHFHYDHYRGLTARFDRGLVYCTPATAALVAQELKLPEDRLRAVPLGQSVVVEGVRVTFLDANHCPGAAMLLFEPPGGRPVLHTGDARLVRAMQEEPALQAMRGHADLILDTTFCSPDYAFPPQEEVLRFVVDAVRAEAFNPRTLFLFGTYTIGKEKVFLEAARALKAKVYVSKAKLRVLEAAGVSPELRALLTTDHLQARLHAVPLAWVRHDKMAAQLRHYRGRFDTVVGFVPSGWSHQRAAGSAKARGRRRQKGTIITYQVPYSEHSSFSELKAFVDWFNPRRIVPSVNADAGGPKSEALVRLLRD